MKPNLEQRSKSAQVIEPARPGVRDRSRRRILDAARAIITEHGVEALTMRGLGDRAGVSVQTLYNVLGNRSEVITALVADELSRLDEEINALPLDDPVRHLRSQVELLIDSAITRTQRPLALVVLDDAAFTERIHAAWQSNTSIEAGITTAIERGILDDAFAPSPLADHLRDAIVHGIRLWAAGVLDDTALLRRALYALDITLLAAATDDARPALLDHLRHDLAIGEPSTARARPSR